MEEIRPRRSMLYMPGANAKAMDKARTLAADSLIFDLEDAVAPDAKPGARDLVIAALTQGGYGERECLVRINPLDSPWGRDDVLAVARSPAHGLVIPKVESARQVHEVGALLDAAGTTDALRIWCMIETPRGVLDVRDIAAAGGRLAGLILGTSDLAKDLRCAHTPQRLPMITSLGLSLLAARAYGLTILDGVHLDLEDAEGFAAACLQGRELGFDGKTLIHPKTIAKANEIFGPSESDIAQARNIVRAFEAAERDGKGVVVVEGRLVERLHVDSALHLLRTAEAIAARAPPAASPPT